MTLYRSFPLHIPKTLQTQKTDSIFVHWLLRYSIFCCLLGGLLVPLEQLNKRTVEHCMNIQQCMKHNYNYLDHCMTMIHYEHCMTTIQKA